jgi:hypothetical protein
MKINNKLIINSNNIQLINKILMKKMKIKYRLFKHNNHLLHLFHINHKMIHLFHINHKMIHLFQINHKMIHLFRMINMNKKMMKLMIKFKISHRH